MSLLLCFLTYSPWRSHCGDNASSGRLRGVAEGKWSQSQLCAFGIPAHWLNNQGVAACNGAKLFWCSNPDDIKLNPMVHGSCARELIHSQPLWQPTLRILVAPGFLNIWVRNLSGETDAFWILRFRSVMITQRSFSLLRLLHYPMNSLKPESIIDEGFQFYYEWYEWSIGHRTLGHTAPPRLPGRQWFIMLLK